MRQADFRAIDFLRFHRDEILGGGVCHPWGDPCGKVDG
ncbi:MAG: hypothetical protein JWM16_5389 [Verrucomicrobiales bacterium]|nr:hypothetical protein [Verrucomicrobiales bacterium]